MKRFIFVLVCLIASASVAQGNGTITGTVIDAATSLPIAGAVVTFLGQNNSWGTTTTTDASGGFTQSVPPDIYFANVSADGYVRQLYDHIPCPGYCAPNDG
ncbi:MAG TPA: carboxypeptidase-like regulatory domain-containing protein, partial [Acidobacteriota bacterium]|nr:carboxypeptidase-like regulatory domain-containing protein [Acidobacteriota bacterium]